MNASNWISVNERLPNQQDIAKNGGRFLIALNSCIFEAKYGGYGFESIGDRSALAPSHWQPLPDPPKRESSFEAWLAKQPLHQITSHPMIVPIVTEALRDAFDAGVAAAKRPDFVP